MIILIEFELDDNGNTHLMHVKWNEKVAGEYQNW